MPMLKNKRSLLLPSKKKKLRLLLLPLLLLKKHPGLSVVIEAHTDATGSNASNLQLSQARAQSILDYLVQGGAAIDHLVPIGHGENAPIATNTTSRGRALNRRVDFRLVMRDEQAYTRP